MSKRFNKLFAFFLAAAIVTSTFGSDLASTTAYASENGIDTVNEDSSSEESIWEGVSDDTEDPVIIDTQTLDETDLSNEEDVSSEDGESIENSNDNANEGAETDASNEDAASSDDTNALDVTNEDASDDASTEGSSAVEAATEATSDDAAALLSSEEELKFNQSKEIDGIKISLYAEEGVLPADAELRVEKVEVEKEEKIAEKIDDILGEDKDVVKTYSYDINIYSESKGSFVQPEDGTVSVKFESIEEAADTSKSLAVYHVQDDVSDADRVALAYSDATEVSFEAEHFSIYAVTLYENHILHSDNSYKVSINVVDEYGKDITEGQSREVDLYKYILTNHYFISVEDLAVQLCENVNNQHFSFVSATYKGQKITSFDKPNGEKKIVIYNGDTKVVDLKDVGEGDIVFTYEHTTYHHLDLGFMDPEEYAFYAKNAIIKAKVNGIVYTLSDWNQDPDIKSYEFRAELKGFGVSTSDEVEFTIYYGNQKFTYTTTLQDNYDAAVRCYDTHKHRKQDNYGFDYVLSFSENFELKGDVVYHKNDGTSAKWADSVKWNWKDKDTKKYTVLSIDDVAKKGDAPADFNKVEGKKFVGWMDKNGNLVNKDTIDITRNTTTDLYAKWEDASNKKDVYFYVLLPNKAVPASSAGQPKADYFPVDGPNYYSWKGSAVYLYDSSLDAYRDNNKNIYDISGAKVKYANYEAPVSNINSDLATSNLFKNVVMMDGSKPTANDIVWYVYKNASDNDEAHKYHIDGYVKGARINVTYHANYKNGPANKSEFAESGSNYSVKGYTDVFSARPGYEFVGWNSQADGKGKSYSPYDPVFLMASCEFYAQWKAVDYTTTYVDEDGQTVLGTKNQEYGETTYTLATDPTKKDYEFTGWVKVGDETQTKVTTASIKQTKVGGDVTYRATYSKKIYEAYYEVHYYYQTKNGSGDKAFVEDKKSARKNILVQVDATVNDGKVAVSVEDADKQRTTYNNYTYVLDTTGAEWSGYVTKENTKNNPLKLKVYYMREHKGVKMTLTAGSLTKYYDGTSARTNEILISVIDGNGKDITSDYKVTYSRNKGGEENANNAASQNIIDAFTVENTRTGEVYCYNTTASGSKVKNVIFKNNKITCEIKDEKFEVDEITILRGSLMVKPRPITITIPGAAKTYDGKSYDPASYSGVVTYSVWMSEEEKAAGKTLDIVVKNVHVTIPSDIKTVNQSLKAFDEIGLKDDYTIAVDGNVLKEKYKKSNFVVTVTNGDLVINPAKVKLVSADLEKKFDFKPLVNGDTPLKVEEGFAEGEGAVYTFTGSQLNPGTSANSFTYVAKSGTDFSNYAFKDADGTSFVEFGTLKVTPDDNKWKIVVSLHADAEGDGNDTYVKYSGVEQSADMNIKVHIVTTEDEHVVPDEETPGDEGRAFGYSILNGMKSMAGTLVARAMDVRSLFVLTVHAEDKEITETVDVNGTTITLSGLKVTGGSGTEVGDYAINLDYTNLKITTADGEEIRTDIIDKSTEPIGYLHVLPRKITVTSASASRAYDGNPLTAHSVTYSGEDTFVEGEGIIINYTGSRTDVGTSKNAFTYSAMEGTKLSNYAITAVEGDLTITGGGDNPPSPPTPPTPPTTIETPAAPAQAVLGARREEPAANGQAVLGARRGRTSDDTNVVIRFSAIVIAAGVLTTIFLTGKRKKKEDE